MTTILLVRHAAHGLVDKVLVGRNQDVGLSEQGWRQARRLGQCLARTRIAAVQSSPQRRARETALPIARAVGRPCLIVPALDEIDAGAWTGRAFDDLATDPRWTHWNAQRDHARIPQGEDMRDVLTRALTHLTSVAAQYPHRRVVVVSHAEVIRAVILHFRGIPFDDFMRVRVDPAFVTTIRVHTRGGEVVRENEPPDLLVAA